MNVFGHSVDFSTPQGVSTFLNDLERELSLFHRDGYIIIGGGEPIYKYRSVTETWNPANLLSGAQQTEDVTVSGAALGDIVGVSFSLALQGTNLWGEVQSTDTIRVYHRNDTGGALDLASGTLRVSVWSHTKQ